MDSSCHQIVMDMCECACFLLFISPSLSALLFSATFKRKVERLARDILTDPVKVVQGELGEVRALLSTNDPSLQCGVSYLASSFLLRPTKTSPRSWKSSTNRKTRCHGCSSDLWNSPLVCLTALLLKFVFIVVVHILVIFRRTGIS